MNDIQKELITKIVYVFAKKASANEEVINDTINKLCSMNIDDAIDSILVSLSGLLDKKEINENDILENEDLLVQLNPSKYPSIDTLKERLQWIKSMNLEYPKMPLIENHKLVMEVFDNLNKLLGYNFDCYYTGGLMGYIATNQDLQRFHGDLDLFINEEELITLKELIDQSPDFCFVSNMKRKEENGHEYKIIYKDVPISVGLFLFERIDDSVVIKEYYYENKDINGQLYVNENHLTKDYSRLTFTNRFRHYNGSPYKMTSLESIYSLKKDARPKDKFDAKIIEDYVNMSLVGILDFEKQKIYEVKNKPLDDSVIQQIECENKKKI